MTMTEIFGLLVAMSVVHVVILDAFVLFPLAFAEMFKRFDETSLVLEVMSDAFAEMPLVFPRTWLWLVMMSDALAEMLERLEMRTVALAEMLDVFVVMFVVLLETGLHVQESSVTPPVILECSIA